MYFWKIINIFYKDYSKKLITTSLPIDSTLPIAKPLAIKQKQYQLIKLTNQAKKTPTKN